MFWGRNMNYRIHFRVLEASGQAELLPKCQRKWVLSSAPICTLNCYCINTLHTPPKFFRDVVSNLAWSQKPFLYTRIGAGDLRPWAAGLHALAPLVLIHVSIFRVGNKHQHSWHRGLSRKIVFLRENSKAFIWRLRQKQ